MGLRWRCFCYNLSMNKNTYRSIVTPQFREMLAKLPAHIQKSAREGFEAWRKDPALVGWKRLKMMNSTADVFSVEIGLRYRAIGVLSKEHHAVVWLFAGSHETYNNFIDIRRSMNQEKWLGGSVMDRLKKMRAAEQTPTTKNPLRI